MDANKIHPIKLYSLLHKRKIKSLAAAVGVSSVYISQLINGYRYPSMELAIAIEEETGGEVKAKSIVKPARNDCDNSA